MADVPTALRDSLSSGYLSLQLPSFKQERGGGKHHSRNLKSPRVGKWVGGEGVHEEGGCSQLNRRTHGEDRKRNEVLVRLRWGGLHSGLVISVFYSLEYQ